MLFYENTSPFDVMVAGLTLFGEARSEPERGKMLISMVILNRAFLKSRPIAQICLNDRQFSCWNGLRTLSEQDDDPNLPRMLAKKGFLDAQKAQCFDLFTDALQTYDPAKFDRAVMLTHYHTKAVRPNWIEGHTPKVVEGAHLFYANIPW